MATRPDQNLLIALYALLEEQHVGKAARRIGVSQPAASAMLARLRRHFGDELLVRVGNGYQPTPFAAQLREQAGGIVQLSDRLFSTKSQFDPRTSEREFTLTVSDYLPAVFGRHLLAAFERQAPCATLRFQQFGNSEHDRSDTAIRSVDGVIVPRGALPPELPRVELFSDEWVAVLDPNNPLTEFPADWDELSELRWVLGQHDRGRPAFLLHRLAESGRELRPHAVIGSFLALPLYVTGTDRIAIVQRRLLRVMPASIPLRVLPCPFDVGPIIEALWWHPVHTHDLGHQWFRTMVHAAAARMDEGVSAVAD